MFRILRYSRDMIDLCKIEDIENFGVLRALVFVEVSKRSAPCVILEMQGRAKTFIWEQNEEEIETLLGLIDGLICYEGSGHQYFTRESDGHIIELSYNED